MGLTNHNNELKFRLQAMEQQAQLRDGINLFPCFTIEILKECDSFHGDPTIH